MNTQHAATIADRILDRLIGDGIATKTRLGVPREKLVRRIGRVDVRNLDCVEYTFSDGSVIQDYGGGWDTPEGWESNR